MRFGYSDRVRVYLGGRLIYAGNNDYRSRDFRYLGTIGWFDALYRAAGDDCAQVPWADLEPHPVLAEWIARSGNLHEGKAIDVGCGLGGPARVAATRTGCCQPSAVRRTLQMSRTSSSERSR